MGEGTVDQLGREALDRVWQFVTETGGGVGGAARTLLERHGYAPRPAGGGPHRNVAGHPLFELPVWVDRACGAPTLDLRVHADIAESALFGYLSVRVEDDHLDESLGDAADTLMLSRAFASRHASLLARHVDDVWFWDRFDRVWRDYAEAMLFERELRDPGATYDAGAFAAVLDRSQPLELPAAAVLALRGRGHLADALSDMVRHLTRATQLFDDFVDAPGDLAAGHHTWMVRRLGGMEGPQALGRGMVVHCADVLSEANAALSSASVIASEMGMNEIEPWIEARTRMMADAARRMYDALLPDPGDR